MKLLIKYPTRGRPQKSVNTLKKYLELANDIENTKIIVSIDEDDTMLTEKMFTIHPCIRVYRGPSSGKIGAINRDMPDPFTFDIVLLASDDMIPQVKGYDDIIRNRMSEHFPDTDGVLFFNDGHSSYKLNTLIVCGSRYYQRFGYLYCPEYKSLFCDNEFTDEANKLGRQVYFNEVIIKHEHWWFGETIVDDLYTKNQRFFNEDKLTYESRKFKKYDLSVLICTIPSRINMFTTLLNKLTKLKQTVSLNIEILYDDTEKISIGEKRNSLLSKASGTYCAFIDDDDDVTDEYFKVIEESELKYDCVTLNGILYKDGVKTRPFYHSLKYDRWFEDEDGYYRNPNHLNPIKTEIAKQIKFPISNFGEDHDFSKLLLKSGLLKSEYRHSKIQYLYMFVSDKVIPPIPRVNPLQRILKINYKL